MLSLLKFLFVNAVYFPENAGGGTIICKNMSDRLKMNGHVVKVFSGHSDKDTPLLSMKFHNIDGVEVSSCNVRNSTEHFCENNYRNPQVEKIFKEIVQDFRPDLVHFHSLHSLGAGLIPIAKEFGSKTMLTIHDYWWACPYQFLIVPEKGRCGRDGFDHVFADRCDCFDKSFLNERRRYLRLMASQNDLIHVYSKNTEVFMKGIGIDPALIRYCESGVAPPGRIRNRRSFGRLKVGYVGTKSYIKGYPLIEQIADSLKVSDGVQFLLYCTSDDRRNELFKYLTLKREAGKNIIKKTLNRFFHTDYQLHLYNPVVKYLPPFNQDELDRVYATMDILILPSLIESFSLATREALIRGVPVIASDAKGPEEIIVDGVNGFIVPAGDMQALREKILLCAQDRALLARLKDGARKTVVTTLQQQWEGLFKIYEELLGAKI